MTLIVGPLLLIAACAVAVQQWNAPPDVRVIPLWQDLSESRSTPVELHSPGARHLVLRLEHSLAHHLAADPGLDCLCAYHLQGAQYYDKGVAYSYQVCAVAGSATPVRAMVNPQLMGHGNESDTYTERPGGVRRARYRTVLVEWYDMETTQLLWARFEGPRAACLQRVLEEMNAK